MVPVVIQCVRCFVGSNCIPFYLLFSAMPLHGWLCSLVNSSVVDKQKSFVILYSETKSTIILAIQNQVIATKVIESKVMHKLVPSLNCRLCGHAEETIVHLLSACPVLAPTVYNPHRHNLVAKAIHWHLMRVYSFSRTGQSWCSHKPPSVLESSDAKILCDFSLRTDHNHSSNCPDIVLFVYQQKKIVYRSLMPSWYKCSSKGRKEAVELYWPGCWFPANVLYASNNNTGSVGLHRCSIHQMFKLFKDTPRVYPKTVC